MCELVHASSSGSFIGGGGRKLPCKRRRAWESWRLSISELAAVMVGLAGAVVG
jgi:hypothetical protein